MMTATEIRELAAKQIETQFMGDVCVMWEAGPASAPTLIYGQKGWTSTPFQGADGGILAVAGWLWREGGCPSRVADLQTDGSAIVYQVQFADEEDVSEDDDLVVGTPIGFFADEEIDAPEEEEQE